jgi:proteic killer suppression protein
VKISFADKKLEKMANDDRKMLSALGKIRATILRRRLTQLEDAATLEEVRYLAGNYHELKNDRKGQWGCDLDQPYRLVFTPHENPIPTNEDGQYIWLEITGVEVIDIVNYHKEK